LSEIDQRYIHKNCIYYSDGFCTFNGVSVNPDGPACPRFTPRQATRGDKQEEPQPSQPYPPQGGQGYAPRGWGAGFGRGGGRGRGQGGGGRGRRASAGFYDADIPLPEPTSLRQEKQFLMDQLKDLEEKLKNVKDRLEKLDQI